MELPTKPTFQSKEIIAAIAVAIVNILNQLGIESVTLEMVTQAINLIFPFAIMILRRFFTKTKLGKPGVTNGAI